jgi:hypothetical protein
VNRDTHISRFIPQIYPARSRCGWLRDIAVGNSKPVIPHQRKNSSTRQPVTSLRMTALSGSCGIKLVGVQETLR